MRLYLSSFDLGTAPAELAALAPRGRVALVMNALDDHPAARERWRLDQSGKLAALGFAVADLDLRHFFGAPERLESVLGDVDLVWMNGGNAFNLRRALKASGMDDLMLALLRRDRIVYAGFSAAAVIASASLRGLEAVDDPDDVPDGYPPDIVWDGLGILSFSVVVHYRSNHPESAAVEREVRHYADAGIPYRTLRDGEAFVVNGDLDGLAKVGSPV